jgi:5-methylcytosine-specific restriction endonuclease McrA
MPLRRCLDYGNPGCLGWTRSGSLCNHCKARRRARRDGDRKLSAQVTAAATACAICGRPPTPSDPLTLDHRLPVSRGGTSAPGNVQAAHRSCNSGKRDR